MEIQSKLLGVKHLLEELGVHRFVELRELTGDLAPARRNPKKGSLAVDAVLNKPRTVALGHRDSLGTLKFDYPDDLVLFRLVARGISVDVLMKTGDAEWFKLKIAGTNEASFQGECPWRNIQN